jgi:hypothetical protein
VSINLSENNSGGEAVGNLVVEVLGRRIGGEAQDLAAGDSSEACGAVDEQEAQGLDAVARAAFLRPVRLSYLGRLCSSPAARFRFGMSAQ